MAALEALDPRRVWRKRSIDSHISRLRDCGIVRRVKRSQMHQPAVYVRVGVEVQPLPFKGMALPEVIAEILRDKGPMRQTDLVLAMLAAGYQSTMTPKSFASSQSEVRYSSAQIIGIEKITRMGNPAEDMISTSYAERLNLSVRMHVRRFTRLTNAHSKSAQHHEAMTSLFVCWYNFCRKNQAVGTTPAVKAGLAEKSWSLETLLLEVA
ncbi:MAG: hypothetical protein JW809_15990 [Pirellulales bacterium]|nr:hypothetical protein [Pirellulales bacterium]